MSLIFYHAPRSRSTGTLALLKELNADYEIKRLDLQKGENLLPEYLAINPMGKVPALIHNGTVITEQVAVTIYLGDIFGLAPALTDPSRGSYLRWIAFYGSCFEPALMDKARNVDPGRRSSSPYADFDTTLNTLRGALANGPYLLGETFSAADMLWGAALGWILKFKLLPGDETLEAYAARINARPSVIWAYEQDAKWSVPAA